MTLTKTELDKIFAEINEAQFKIGHAMTAYNIPGNRATIIALQIMLIKTYDKDPLKLVDDIMMTSLMMMVFEKKTPANELKEKMENVFKKEIM